MKGAKRTLAVHENSFANGRTLWVAENDSHRELDVLVRNVPVCPKTSDAGTCVDARPGSAKSR